ncbi:hypothetical protein BT96DRAFT_1039996 [Gymnopus androsaceus JB14]|uniref:Secreted protein n=1 Tax=Gymnopus androsaceus JB14 TaxID=1447944 RepID=A0A6A4HGX2_9AGAR|nr:hypothetical protein BT96DRAFT_1039996 [Gymnopus androsaceus JB14]
MRFPTIITALSAKLVLLLMVGQTTANDDVKRRAILLQRTPADTTRTVLCALTLELQNYQEVDLLAKKTCVGTQVAHNGALKTGCSCMQQKCQRMVRVMRRDPLVRENADAY